MAYPSDFNGAHDLAGELRYEAEIAEDILSGLFNAAREAADMIELFADRINHLTNVNDGLRETLDTQRAGLAELKAMLATEKSA